MNNLNYKTLFKISILSQEEKRDGYIKMIYKDCLVCGNTKNSFWVKIYKCSRCGADKFKWHTRAWCGTMLDINKNEQRGK